MTVAQAECEGVGALCETEDGACSAASDDACTFGRQYDVDTDAYIGDACTPTNGVTPGSWTATEGTCADADPPVEGTDVTRAECEESADWDSNPTITMKRVYGCIDPTAYNYAWRANTEDGSCIGRLTTYGAPIDGTLIGSPIGEVSAALSDYSSNVQPPNLAVCL